MKSCLWKVTKVEEGPKFIELENWWHRRNLKIIPSDSSQLPSFLDEEIEIQEVCKSHVQNTTPN